MTAADPTAPTARIEVLRGGEPTPAQLAALIIGLTPVPGRASAPSGPPAWWRAAAREATGGRRAVRPSDLTQPHRPG